MENYFNTLKKEQANLVLLVLASQGISANFTRDNDSFDIVMKNADEKIATQILEKYFTENKAIKENFQNSKLHLSWKSPAVFAIMAMLAFIHIYSRHNEIHGLLVREYGSSALYILQSEYFRAVTALLLHADIEHLAGNLVGLFVFGTGVFSLTGYGRGSLMLLLSGFLGNVTNAYFKKGVYLSIGASTCVLGAAGILTALQITKKRKTSMSNIQILAPFAAGMALLALLSGGENTDISAHLFGFLWGFLIGVIYSAVVTKEQKKGLDNIMYAGISIIIILAAWMKYF
ncbi:MAG: rhomboid family intramembrane serine protease [Desulfobacteraceae bacterium]|nr:rhomboid family intramembrane serine protease [Desulfobacteraceae bacterium]